MKVQLTSDWIDFGHLHKSGSVVDVSDADGVRLVAAGHIQVHPDTPAKINPEMYTVGCVPNPFVNENSAAMASMAVWFAQNEPPESTGTKTETNKK